MSDMSAIEILKQWVLESKRIVFFGGAGVSTESGIPDFRGVDGLYRLKYAYPPETILSHDFFLRRTDEFYRFYRDKMLITDAQPNPAHLKLAQWEQEGRLSAVVTQNIDGLHQKAGSKKVFEIHGTTTRNYCSKCGKSYPEDYIYESKEAVPHCTCGGVIRCDVTLYEESLPDAAVNGALRALQNADLMIIGGTSLTVYPAASFIRYFGGKNMVVINRDKLNIRLDPEDDLEINEPIGQVFTEAAKILGIDLN